MLNEEDLDILDIFECDPKTNIVYKNENGNWELEYVVEPENIQDDGTRYYVLSDKVVQAMHDAWIID